MSWNDDLEHLRLDGREGYRRVSTSKLFDFTTRLESALAYRRLLGFDLPDTWVQNLVSRKRELRRRTDLEAAQRKETAQEAPNETYLEVRQGTASNSFSDQIRTDRIPVQPR